jgi:hypothetical protein
MGLVKSGESLELALKRIGISRSTYYRWFALAQESRTLLSQAKTELEMVEYADIVLSKGEILRAIIKDGLDPNTFASDRISIYQLLRSEVSHLEEKYRPSDGGADFLRGPSLEPGVSTHRDVTIEVGGVKINITDKGGDILDGRFNDESLEDEPEEG